MKFSNQKKLWIFLIFFILGSATFIFISRHTKYTNTINEPVITPSAYNKLSPTVDTSSWKTFTDKQLKLHIKYPSSVMIDSRQTVEGRLDVFIFAEDKDEPLPGSVPVLYIANTHKEGRDGFSAFQKGDCTKPCTISYKTTEWVNITNVYGIKNPLPGDVANYYLTDKDQQGLVINAYVGGYKNISDKIAKEKMDTFDQMIRTIQIENSKSHGHTK